MIMETGSETLEYLILSRAIQQALDCNYFSIHLGTRSKLVLVLAAPRVRLAVVVGAVRRVVELVHAAVRQHVHVVAQDRHKERREEQYHERHRGSHGQPLAEQPCQGSVQQLVARRVSAEVGVVEHMLHSAQQHAAPAQRAEVVAEGRVLLHVVVKFIRAALLEQPPLVFSLQRQRCVREVQHVHARQHKHQQPHAEQEG